MGEKEMRQLEFPPEFGGEKEEEQKPKPKVRRKSTLRLRGDPRNYLPGVLKEKVNLRGLERLLRAVGRDVTHQPELKGLEKTPEEKGPKSTE